MFMNIYLFIFYIITLPFSSSIFYSYDSLNRITHAKYSSGYFELFTYDKRGNRLSKKTPDETINYKYSKEGQLLKAGNIQFFYDDDGNLIKKISPGNISKYRYNADNFLIFYEDNFNRVEFEYDAFGNRISKTVNGIKTEYINDTSSPISRVILKRSSKSSTKYKYDKEGNLVKVIDSEGAVFRYEYIENSLSRIEYPDSYAENF